MRSLVGALLNADSTPKTPVPMVGRASGGLFGAFMRQSGASSQLAAMEAVGTVFGIVDKLANATSQVNWHLWKKAKSGKKEDRTEVTSHLALDIWNKPNSFHCLVPETRVVTEELEWVPVGELRVGDKLLGFEETQQPGKRRQWKSSQVVATGRKMLPCYRIFFADGTQVVASEEHRWLTQMPSNGSYWRMTKDLMGRRPGGNYKGPTRVQKLLDVWEQDTSYAGGYLAGAFDGEGTLYRPRRGEHSTGMSFAQRDNEMLAEMERLLPEVGFRAKRTTHPSTGVQYLHILGGAPEIIRFLGTVRPRRLLAKWRSWGTDHLGTIQRVDNVAVVGLEFLGEREVVTLGTSTETFVAEGFGTHNTRQELVEQGQQHAELMGETWLVVARDPRARSLPLELWEISPERMEPVPNADRFLAGYLYRSPDGEMVPLERQDVLFARRPDPRNPYRGLGPIKPALTDIDSARYAAEWNRNFFLNSAEPGGIVEIDRRLSDDEFNELVARWREQHQGVAQAHRVAVLEQVKWVDRKYTMRDMQFAELRGVTSAAIREAFGFPKFMLGQVDDVNRATAEASEAMFAQWLTVPRLERWKQLLNNDFLPLFGTSSSGMEFDYDDPVPANSEAENAARTSKVNAATSLLSLTTVSFDPAETLKAFDLPDIPFEKPAPPPPAAGPPAPGAPADAGLPPAPGEIPAPAGDPVLQQLLALKRVPLGRFDPLQRRDEAGRWVAFEARIEAAASGQDALQAAGASLDLDVRDVGRMGLRSGGQWPDDAARQYHRDFRNYQGAGYEPINDGLRAEGVSGDRREQVARMDDVFADSPLSSDVVAWRGMDGRSVRLFGDRLGGDLTGFEWREQAYVSTGIRQRTAQSWATTHDSAGVAMRILVPKGTGSVDMGSSEDELLLQRGLRMRVVADHGMQEHPLPGIKSKYRLLDVEVVPG